MSVASCSPPYITCSRTPHGSFGVFGLHKQFSRTQLRSFSGLTTPKYTGPSASIPRQAYMRTTNLTFGGARRLIRSWRSLSQGRNKGSGGRKRPTHY